jgi:hypothetical protein
MLTVTFVDGQEFAYGADGYTITPGAALHLLSGVEVLWTIAPGQWREVAVTGDEVEDDDPGEDADKPETEVTPLRVVAGGARG